MTIESREASWTAPTPWRFGFLSSSQHTVLRQAAVCRADGAEVARFCRPREQQEKVRAVSRTLDSPQAQLLSNKKPAVCVSYTM